MKRTLKIEIEFPRGSNAEELIGQFQSFINMSQDLMLGRYKKNSLNHFWKERLNRDEKRKFLAFLSYFQDKVNDEKELNFKLLAEETEQKPIPIQGTYQIILNNFRDFDPGRKDLIRRV